MKCSENAINVMAARIYKGIGRAWIVKNLSTPKPEEAIVKLLNESSKSEGTITIEDFNKKKSMLRRILSESVGAKDGGFSVLCQKVENTYAEQFNLIFLILT